MLTTDDIAEFVANETWKSAFDSGAIVQGIKLARARQIQNVKGEFLDTGDAEITATIIEKNGSRASPVVALWAEGDALAFDADCSCSVKVNCAHSVAIFDYLTRGKGARVEAAFGGTPEVEKVIQNQADIKPASELFATDSARPDRDAPKCILRVERRPEGDELAWLPDVYAMAYLVSGKEKFPLAGGGSISRNFNEERHAIGQLDSLGLIPGAEEPPQSLRKLKLPEFDSRLWAPDKQRFPHPKLFWQKFWIEWGPALEKAGWEIQYASNIQIKPLLFRTESWKAEIVEEGKGWFHLSAGFEIDGEKFDLQPILAALVTNRFLENTAKKPPGQEFLVFMPDGRGIAVPIGRFRKILTTLGELLDYKFTDGPIKVSKIDAALIAAAGEDDEETELEISIPPEVDDLSELLADFEGIERVPVPEGMRATLRDYQLDGYHWMQFLLSYGLHGILADDMGLGKTLQTLTHILAEKETGRNEGRPCLVIAPTSVVENWQREAEKFAPDLSVLILQGGGRKRDFRHIPDHDIVMTSYALVYRDLGILSHHEFHLLILDEAQHIKNPAAQTTRAVAELNAEHRLCLSGTPVENNLGELWSLMNFLMPGLLGTRELFQANYRNPIEKDKSEARSRHLAARVGPLILRRTKNDVAKELPPKTEIDHRIDLNEEQKDLYETVRSTMDRRVREALKLQGKENQIVFLEALLKLRQICCHPQLLKRDKPEEGSAKFDYLVELLETLRQENHRILIFSQFTSMLSIIEEHLQEVDCSYLRLTGETRDRQSLVERFQGGEGEVFLISLKAGGTGLTLTGADNVIHYDPWWNPAVEDQATDRAYRIGQDKPVFVHKLICKGTVEDRIRQMQEKKSNIAEGILSGATQGLSLTPEVLSELFSPIS